MLITNLTSGGKLHKYLIEYLVWYNELTFYMHINIIKFLVVNFPTLSRDVANYKRNASRLLFIPFVELDQYLHDLEVICSCLHKCGTKVLIYLAAAVSDFYVHEERLVNEFLGYSIRSTPKR